MQLESQFHYGSIKTTFIVVTMAIGTLSQFHYGSIKTKSD